MKKVLLLVFVFITGFTLLACDNIIGSSSNLDNKQLSSEESFVTLSYLSAGLLDMSSTGSSNLMSFNLLADGEETEVEGELDDINVYFDLLKEIIDNGTSVLGQIQLEVSDRAEYQNKVTFSVGEDSYLLYFNVDAVTAEISGIFVIGDVEYTITAHNYLSDSQDFEDEYDDEDEDDEEDELEDEDEFDDEDDDEYEDEEDNDQTTTEEEFDGEAGSTVTEDLAFHQLAADSNDNEEKMELIATNGDDVIKITYKIETDDEETETKFELEKTIAGVTSSLELKISQEVDEYKVEIEDGNNYFEFKQEVEDNETVYKLEYKVDGVEGEVRIFEVLDEEGNLTYEYEIKEGEKEHKVEKDEPRSEGYDHDDDDLEDEENDL